VTPGENWSWLVVCDHASRRFPRALGEMGLSDADSRDHIAWDIGGLDAARRLATRLNAPLIECGYSRLVIDCNRYPHKHDAAPEVSDRRRIPGNEDLSPQARDARVAEIFIPYHQAIAAHLDAALAKGIRPVFLSVHTCTARMGGKDRPWEIGVGWTRDARTAAPLLAALEARGDVVVGDNEPYGLDLGLDFTTPEHAMTRGLAHLQIEFRNDLVTTQETAEAWADKLFEAITSIEDQAGWRQEDHHLTESDGILGDGNLDRFLSPR
jgi:predicted N-formylglutamate amidohydrolase